MIVVRCKQCGTEVKSPHSCGCPNMLTVTGDTFTAVDLTSIVVVTSNQKKEKDGLTSEDLQWQEQRRKRKVRKLNFEVR
jgi:hypothetical protein